MRSRIRDHKFLPWCQDYLYLWISGKLGYEERASVGMLLSSQTLLSGFAFKKNYRRTGKRGLRIDLGTDPIQGAAGRLYLRNST